MRRHEEDIPHVAVAAYVLLQAPLPGWCCQRACTALHRWHAKHGFAKESFMTARNHLPAVGLLESQARVFPGLGLGLGPLPFLFAIAVTCIRDRWHVSDGALSARSAPHLPGV